MGFDRLFKGLILFSSTCFDHPSVHPQEEYIVHAVQYGIFSC